MLMTVAELPEYQRRAERLLSEDERHDIVSYLAAFPKDGDLIRSTGGSASCVGDEVGGEKAEA